MSESNASSHMSKSSMSSQKRELKSLKLRRDALRALLNNYRAKINDQETNVGDSAMALDLRKEMRPHLDELSKVKSEIKKMKAKLK